MDYIRKQIEESLQVKKLILEDIKILNSLKEAASLCCVALKNDRKIIFAGNGGSAADAQHLAAELVNRFGFERPGLTAIAITTDTSILTSISNDYGFNKLFARQINALGKQGDILVSISTSGNSANILEGISEAKKKNLINIGFTGETGGRMKEMCDVCIRVPSGDTARIQEAHILLGHIMCSIIENSLFGK